jgi:hypothetical protein
MRLRRPWGWLEIAGYAALILTLLTVAIVWASVASQQP